MLHIIGLNHRAQAKTTEADPTVEQKAFYDCLVKTIEQVRPVLVAEEDSEEALAKRKKVSIAKAIADEKGIEHRFCDPCEKERQAIGYRDGQMLEVQMFMRDQEGMSNDEIFRKARAIEIGRYFPIRERFWLQRLGELRNKETVFVCGDLHIESLGRILDAEHVPFRIVERGIGVTTEDARFYQAIEYLAEHPELANDTSFD